MQDEKIVKKVIKDNSKGLKRLAREEPAAERRSKWKRLKRRFADLFQDEEKVGRITA
jgi:hypothetical protein